MVYGKTVLYGILFVIPNLIVRTGDHPEKAIGYCETYASVLTINIYYFLSDLQRKIIN